MDLVENSITWARGEVFEMTIIIGAGVAIAVVGSLFAHYGVLPSAKAMLLPCLTLAAVLLLVAVPGFLTAQSRITSFPEAFASDPSGFILAEKARVEGFQYLYTVTLLLAPICFAISTAIFWLSMNPHLRAIALVLIVFGFSSLLIDYFSKERADLYYTKILSAIDSSVEQ